MSNFIKFNEDDQIIETPKHKVFQRMCCEAGLFAVKEAKDKGLPITYVENEEIIKEYADGRKEVLGKIKPEAQVTKLVYDLK